MKRITTILLLCFFGITSLTIASSYTDVEKAIKEGDFCLLKKLLCSTTIEKDQLMSLIDVANDVVVNKKNAIQQRQTTVKCAVLLKLIGPFTGLMGFAIGGYLDPRGLSALGMLVAGGAIVALLSQPEGAIERRAQLTGSYAACCFVIGFALIEKYFWKRAKMIDKDLQKDYETAVSCKNLLVPLI